jgi:hypothetical protein
VQLADAAGNELGVLAAEVEDDDGLRRRRRGGGVDGPVQGFYAPARCQDFPSVAIVGATTISTSCI